MGEVGVADHRLQVVGDLGDVGRRVLRLLQVRAGRVAQLAGTVLAAGGVDLVQRLGGGVRAAGGDRG
ncbi:hypothetical protein, partial [Isoptericola sp. NPDC060257]|uniref:hypothetical protein n=1 Tax=Isoptericola sp. NPDC060257 TaxID=3347087 RepID=UPI0036652CE6